MPLHNGIKMLISHMRILYGLFFFIFLTLVILLTTISMRSAKTTDTPLDRHAVKQFEAHYNTLKTIGDTIDLTPEERITLFYLTQSAHEKIASALALNPNAAEQLHDLTQATSAKLADMIELHQKPPSLTHSKQPATDQDHNFDHQSDNR